MPHVSKTKTDGDSLGIIYIYSFWKKKKESKAFTPFPGGSDGKESACITGNLGSIPGSGRSSGERNGYSLQYSCFHIGNLEKYLKCINNPC